MWFQYFHAKVLNALGDDYTVTRAAELDKYEPYGSAIPTPTPLRNHQMFLDVRDGYGPMYMRTDQAMQALSARPDGTIDPDKMEQVRNEAWEDFVAALDAPVELDPAVKARYTSPPQWHR